ncbi:MAG: glycosyltransferase family 9 protein, partial [Bacteroidales bacterium]|nr:glycosyltransferase family 9 protein [Candidatus Colimorpha onthohippi]
MPTEYRKNILVVRLSALGDVAILQPIVKGRALANPDVLFTVAAPPLLEPLFQGVPNIQFLATPKRQPIYALYQQLAQTRPTVVADMHWVNRVIGVDLLFLAHGTPVYHIHKERLKQKRLVRRWHKTYTTVTPSWQRYEKVFDRCGIAPAQYPTHYIQVKKHSATDIKRRIGIAPFAQHAGKIMPHGQTKQLISILSQKSEYEILLFGGNDEDARLEPWAAEHA